MFIRFRFIRRQINKLAIKRTPNESFVVFVKLGTIIHFPARRIGEFSRGIIARDLPVIDIWVATMRYKIDVSAIKNTTKEAAAVRMNLGGVIGSVVQVMV